MKEVFTLKINDKDVEFAVIKPTVEINQQAQFCYNKAYGDALKSGAPLKAVLDSYMRKQNMWDEERRVEYDKLLDELAEGEKTLTQKGGVKLKDAKQIALNMRRARFRIRNMFADVVDTHVNSAEGQAEQAKFNFLVSRCLVYNTNGEPYFKDVNAYLDKATEPVALMGATLLGKMLYGVDTQETLPENKFLKKYKFVDDSLRLVDKDGNLVDELNQKVDDLGNPVVEESKDEFVPFLDDDGKPIVEVEKVIELPKPVVPNIQPVDVVLDTKAE